MFCNKTNEPIETLTVDNEVNADDIYYLVELKNALVGTVPAYRPESHHIHHRLGVSWDKDTLKMMAGLI